MSREEIIFGWHAVTAALRHAPATLKHVWIEESRRDRRAQDFAQKAAALGIPVRTEAGSVLDRLIGSRHHQGVVARCAGGKPEMAEHEIPAILKGCKSTPLLLALDQVQDPHNLGACLRSADAAGVTAVIAPRDNAAPLTPTVRKVACGAAETVPFVRVTNLSRTLLKLREEHELLVVGGVSSAPVSIYDVDLTVPCVIVLGAEETGLRRLTMERCDVLACIPMTGTVESLNVSVSAGIFLFEVLRQRRVNPVSRHASMQS